VHRFRSPIGRFVFYCLGFGSVVGAQEGSGQATVGFQQYYLSFGSQPVANISGLTLSLDQFVPNVGLLSATFVPALSNHSFRTGEASLRLKGLPWKGQYWTFSAGDFRVPGQLLPVPFTNVFIPEIAGRGAWVEATHGSRSLGFFYGTGTISNTPRVVLRLRAPQLLGGFYFRQRLGTRLLLGARTVQFSNDLTALRKQYNLFTQSKLKSATTLSLNDLPPLSLPVITREAHGQTSTAEARHWDAPEGASQCGAPRANSSGVR